MALLDAEDQHVAIDEDGHELVPPIDAFAAHIFKRQNRQIRGEAVRPCAERLCLLTTRRRRRPVGSGSGHLAFQYTFNEASRDKPDPRARVASCSTMPDSMFRFTVMPLCFYLS